MKNTASSHSKI